MAQLFLACLIGFFPGLRPKVDAEAVKADLDKAREEYRALQEKHKQDLAVFFEQREATAQRAGDKKLLDRYTAERVAFFRTGEVPTSAPADIRKKLTRTRLALQSALKVAVREYTKLGRREEATALDRELEKLQATTLVFGTGGPALLKGLDGKFEFHPRKGVTREVDLDDMAAALSNPKDLLYLAHEENRKDAIAAVKALRGLRDALKDSRASDDRKNRRSRRPDGGGRGPGRQRPRQAVPGRGPQAAGRGGTGAGVRPSGPVTPKGQPGVVFSGRRPGALSPEQVGAADADPGP